MRRPNIAGDYRTGRGRRPVKEFLDGLSDLDAAAVIGGMKDVEINGIEAAKHVREDIYEVVAVGDRQTFRVLFAAEGLHGQVLLALEAFSKKTRKTPPQLLDLAERRLADWRRRGRE